MYQYKNIIIAGINTADEFAEWLKNGKQDTGYYFERKLDHMNMGQVVFLGVDWSEVHYGLSTTPRVDLPEYYEEIKIEEEILETQQEI